MKRPASNKPNVASKKPAWCDTEERTPDIASQAELEESLTLAQRHVWKMNYNKLPADVKEAYEAEKNSTEKGKCKRTNAIVNAIVPKDATYSSTISLEKKTFEVFRQVVCNKKEEDLERGYTFTEITGTGKLGSADKLNEGISRGDVVAKKKPTWEINVLHELSHDRSHC